MRLTDITTEFRGRLIIKAYRRWLKSGTPVLDVGCGNGVISDILRRRFHLRLVGCDVARYLARDVEFVKMTNPTRLPFRSGRFAVVLFTDVLHHVDFGDQERLLREGLRVARRLIVFELNPTPLTWICDWLVNLVHYRKMAMPFAYRTTSGWEEIFSRLGVNWIRAEVPRPWWYPFSHSAFCLDKHKL